MSHPTLPQLALMDLLSVGVEHCLAIKLTSVWKSDYCSANKKRDYCIYHHMVSWYPRVARLWSSPLKPSRSVGGGVVVRDFSLLRLQLHNFSSSSWSSFIFVFECCLHTFHITMLRLQTNHNQLNNWMLCFTQREEKKYWKTQSFSFSNKVHCIK